MNVHALLIDNSNWTSYASSRWSSDGGTSEHLHDGDVEVEWIQQAWSPDVLTDNHGEWFFIDFGEQIEITDFVIHQHYSYVRMTSIGNPVKDSRYLNTLNIQYSDGSDDDVLFSNSRIAGASLDNPFVTSSILATIVDFHDDYVKAGLWAYEFEVYGNVYEPPEPPASIPEPGTIFLLGAGVAGLIAARHRKRNRTS